MNCPNCQLPLNGDESFILKNLDRHLKANVAWAQQIMGQFYQSGSSEYHITKSNKKAKEYFELAVKQKYAPAAVCLAKLFLHGDGVKQSTKKTIQYANLAYQWGDMQIAPGLLGSIYLQMNKAGAHDEGIKWFKIAANEGHCPDALYNLGLMYHRGQFVIRSLKTARKYWMQIIEQKQTQKGMKLDVDKYKQFKIPKYDEAKKELLQLNALDVEECEKGNVPVSTSKKCSFCATPESPLGPLLKRCDCKRALYYCNNICRDQHRSMYSIFKVCHCQTHGELANVVDSTTCPICLESVSFDDKEDKLNGASGRMICCGATVHLACHDDVQHSDDPLNSTCVACKRKIPEFGKESTKVLEKHAKAGKAWAQYMYGDCFLLGDAVPTSLVDALKWTELAAKQNHGTALIRSHQLKKMKASKVSLETMLFRDGSGKVTGLKGGDADGSTREIESLKQAVSVGNVRAMFVLGACHHNGSGICEKSFLATLKLHEMASLRGHADAMYNIGRIYHFGGYGVERDFEKATLWWEMSAFHGNREGQYDLGVVYLEGCERIQKDRGVAIKWLKKAAKNGFQGAQNLIDDVEEKILQRANLRFKKGQRVLCNLGTTKQCSFCATPESALGPLLIRCDCSFIWIPGTIVDTLYERMASERERHRMNAPVVPYQVLLDTDVSDQSLTDIDQRLIYVPVDIDQYCRAIVDPSKCSYCSKEPKTGKKLNKCSGCSSVFYCTRECQTKHWKTKPNGHKKQCKKLAAFRASQQKEGT